jgi:hypothetical protein
MMTAVEQARNEVQAALAALKPDMLGETGFLALPQEQPTAAHLQMLLTDDQRRQVLLQQLHDAAVALLADGYPNVEQPVVDPSILQDLDADITALQAARSRFIAKLPPAKGIVTFATASP